MGMECEVNAKFYGLIGVSLFGKSFVLSISCGSCEAYVTFGCRLRLNF